jgi:hypothetical protein
MGAAEAACLASIVGFETLVQIIKIGRLEP